MRGAWVSKNTDSQLGTVVYFSTLGEVLFGNLLWEVMAALELTHGVADRLLDDNPYPKQRAEKLFPSLTATKWKDALQAASTTSGMDFVETFRFYLTVVDARNSLLHAGNKWAVNPDMPAECMKHVEPMLSLFVELHKNCVLAIYRSRGKPFRLAGS
jgi:hypothetical protein